jgi:exosortase/archaeosortase family protein
LFGTLAIALIALVPLLHQYGSMAWACLSLTNQVAWLIRLSGLQAEIFGGNRIHLASVDWEMVLECTAIGSMLVFSSFLLVFPSSFKAKGIGLLIGLPLIHVANLVRLLAMAWVEELLPGYALYFHDYLWQVVFLIGVAFLWLIWIDKVVSRA